MADEDEKNILIVDGEKLSGLISKMLAGDFSTDVAHDGLNAVQKLREILPHAIVVEVDIPGNGIKLTELLGVNPKYSGVPIILTAANPSPDMIIRSKNAGADSFLAKPFNPSDLKGRISQLSAVRVEAADAAAEGEAATEEGGEAAPAAGVGAEEDENGLSSDLTNRVKSIEGLPSFPATHAEILKLANSEEASSDDIAEKLQLDSGLLATIFKLVNSSGYGFRKKVDSLKLAVTLLGLEEIANLVMAAQVFDKLGNYDDGSGLDATEFWRHSVGVGFAARAISKKLQTEAESAFLAGMLHDVGKIVLDRFFVDYYKEVLNIVGDEKTLIVDAEKDVLGITHADIGAVLASEWKFANTYLNTIQYHHTPGEARRYKRLVCLIHIADGLTRELGFGSGGDLVVPEIQEAALDQFHMADRGVGMLREAVEVELEGADSFLAALKS